MEDYMKRHNKSINIVKILLLLALVFVLCGCRRTVSPYTKAPIDSTDAGSDTDDPAYSEDITEGFVGTMEIEGNDYPVFLFEGLCYCLYEDHAIVVNTMFSDDTLEEYTIHALISYESVDYPVTELDEELFYLNTEAKTINLPSTLLAIGDNAFDGCSNLQQINLPEGLEYIGQSAFTDCTSLKSITIPSTVKQLGSELFFGCTALETVIFNEGVSYIPDGAFSNCESLVTVVIPSTMKTIGGEAFWSCIALKNLTLPEGINTIADRCFYDCEALTELVLPTSITSIGDDLFDYCESLTTLKVPDDSKDRYAELMEGYEFEVVGY